MIRKFKMKKLTRQPHWHKTLSRYSVKTIWQVRSTLSDKNSSDKSVEISAWCRKFCPTKHFVRRKFCPIFQYKSQVKIGQNCRNFVLVSKILSDEIFCLTKIFSNEILSDKVCVRIPNTMVLLDTEILTSQCPEFYYPVQQLVIITLNFRVTPTWFQRIVYVMTK